MDRGKPLDLESPGVDEHFHKHPLDPGGYGVDAADGLPKPATMATMEITRSPALTVDTFVCMGDFSKFVLLDAMGVVAMEFEPHEVVRTPSGWFLKERALDPQELRKAVELVTGYEGAVLQFVRVAPVRPPCEHYRRVLTDMPGDSEHQVCHRHCTALRDENGEFVSINDTRIHACELRSPRDVKSESKLDAFDEEAIAKAGAADVGEFSVEDALAGEPAGGIFDR